MATSLYDLSVTTYLQTLQGVSGFLQKGLDHLGADKANALVETRLHDDMLPFRFQIVSVVHHSRGSLEGVKSGNFAPPSDQTPHDYAGLQTLVADASAALKALTPEEVNGWSGKDVIFALGSFKMPFVAENWVMSFSLPNLHFHATTAYDILRQGGVPLGKRDYMGPLRLKATA